MIRELDKGVNISPSLKYKIMSLVVSHLGVFTSKRRGNKGKHFYINKTHKVHDVIWKTSKDKRWVEECLTNFP